MFLWFRLVLCLGKWILNTSSSLKFRGIFLFPRPICAEGPQLPCLRLGVIRQQKSVLLTIGPRNTCFAPGEGIIILVFRNDKYISTVVEGSPSYYNSLMRLQILNVTQEDLGKYSCKAKNSLGETDGEITLYGKKRVDTINGSRGLKQIIYILCWFLKFTSRRFHLCSKYGTTNWMLRL